MAADEEPEVQESEQPLNIEVRPSHLRLSTAYVVLSIEILGNQYCGCQDDKTLILLALLLLWRSHRA